jgi:hypothetical protein
MKRFLMLVGVAVVAAAMYVAAGTASQQSKGVSVAKFNALEKKVTTLSKTLKQVKAAAADADGFIRSCLLSANGGVLPINQFGDPAGTFGYQYYDGTQTIDTTALDLDLSSPFQGVYLQGVDSACVGSPAGHRLAARTGAGHLSLLQGERSH